MTPAQPGHLYGVGVGPGDPELITLRAARLIREADVIAYHSGPRGASIARGIAASLIAAGVVEEHLAYPVTVGTAEHPLGYFGAISDFYDESAERLAVHLAAGRTVTVLAEGDPLFYGSYMYLHDRLSARFPSTVVPGVTSVSAAAATARLPLVRHEDVLTVLPGTLPVPELARRLADTEGAAIMKLGRTFAGVREALRQAGRLDEAIYVERASTDRELSCPVSAVDTDVVPYFAMILVPGKDRRADSASRSLTGATSPGYVAPSAAATRPRHDGTHPAELLVIGLGPGPQDWLTPEAAAALDVVVHVVGYAPYVNRVPQRAGLTRHASGNTVEIDRARLALDLARSGERVAVVSGGDSGVFGMASAVFEAAQDERYHGVPIRVLPGVTAAQAVAARAGAPLGADYAVLSLSDRLKPWSVIARRLAAVAESDLAMAIYNPASRSRTTQVADARSILLRARPGSTPVVVGRDVGRADESLTVTTLAELDPVTVDMRTLLIVGASSTRLAASGQVWTPRFVVDPVPDRPEASPSGVSAVPLAVEM